VSSRQKQVTRDTRARAVVPQRMQRVRVWTPFLTSMHEYRISNWEAGTASRAERGLSQTPPPAPPPFYVTTMPWPPLWAPEIVRAEQLAERKKNRAVRAAERAEERRKNRAALRLSPKHF
jgi:hypothetical protein